MVSQQFYDREKNDQILFGILSQVMEVHYGESSHHIPRVQRITGILLERLCQKTDRYNLTGADRRLITTAAALHDIGRMAIDGRILNAPDPTPEQKAILRTHNSRCAHTGKPVPLSGPAPGEARAPDLPLAS